MFKQERQPFVTPENLWNRWFILILVLNTISNVSFWLVAPLIADYAVSIGASKTVAGTIVSLMSLAALFTRPVAGVTSDRISRKLLLVLSGSVAAACMFLYAVPGSLPFLAAVRLLHGISFSFNTVSLVAISTLYIPKDKLGEGIGWTVVSTTLAMAAGPGIGSWLMDLTGFSVCFTVAAVGALLPSLAFLLFPYQQQTSAVGKAKKLELNDLISLRILPYAILSGLFSVCSGVINGFLRLMGVERAIEGFAIYFTVYSVVTVLSRPFTGRLLDRRGIRILMYPCILLAALGMFLLGKAQALWMILAAAFLNALGQGSASPTVQAHCLRQLGKEKAGVVSSTCYMGNDIGNVVGPLLGGAIADNYGYGAMFSSVSILLLAVGLPVLFLKTRYDEKRYGPESTGQILKERTIDS